MDFLTKSEKELQLLSNVEKKHLLLKRRIVRNLYFHGSKSAAEISKKLKVSIPTITAIINELISSEVIIDQGQGSSSGGRRPNLFGLQNDTFYILGIDIGRFATKMAIFNTKLENITDFEIYTLKLENDSKQIDIIYQFAEKLISESGVPKDKLIGVGIDMPGIVDSKNGNNYTYYHNDSKSVVSRFEEKFNLPVYIENDAKVRALAEYRYGLAKNKKNSLIIHIGWSLGLGMIINGKLFGGVSGFAGEFGHIPMVENGALCNCGKLGCLETVASGSTLVKLANEGLSAGRNSTLNKMIENGEELIPKTIIDAANNGDQFAISIISKIGFELGKGIAILIQLLNPELIILGGRVAEANQYLLTPIDQALNHYSLQKLRQQTDIKISELGIHTTIIGAVAMAIENIFENK